MDMERQNFLNECDAQNKPKLFAQFKKTFEDKLFSKYGITIGDCTDEETLMMEFEVGSTAEDFVEFVADKRDLNPLNKLF